MANGTAGPVGVRGISGVGYTSATGNITFLKVTPIHCVVAIRGNQTTTITLAMLKVINETVSAPIVDIKAIWFSCLSGSGNTIVRNSVTLWDLPGVPGNYQFDGWSDTQARTSDITVSIGASGGTIILELVKKGGYGDSQQNLFI